MKGSHWSQHQGFFFPQIWGQSLIVKVSKWGKPSHSLLEWNLLRASTTAARRSSVGACSDLHEIITPLLAYGTFRRVADSCWIGAGFLFFPVLLTHCLQEFTKVRFAFFCAVKKWKTSGDVKGVRLKKLAWFLLQSCCIVWEVSARFIWFQPGVSNRQVMSSFCRVLSGCG